MTDCTEFFGYGLFFCCKRRCQVKKLDTVAFFVYNVALCGV